MQTTTHSLTLTDKKPARLLAGIRAALAHPAPRLHLDLLGPGFMLHDTALMVYHALRDRPASTHLHIHSHTCLSDGAVLVWLAGDSRSIRPDAWIELTDPHAPEPPPATNSPDYPTAIHTEDEFPSTTDLRSIRAHLDEFLPVREITGLRLFPAELRDLGLLDPLDPATTPADRDTRRRHTA
jgi:hypothetical protein